MAILMMLGALALHETPLVPKWSAATETRWQQCGGGDAAGITPTDRVAVCTALIADRALDNRQRAYAYAWRANAKSRLSDFDAAFADFDKALAQPGLPGADEAAILIGRADLNRIDGSFEDAEDDLDRAAKLAPIGPDIRIARAKLAIDQSEFAKAREQLSAADRTDLDATIHAELHALRGSAFEREGDQRSALADFDKAVEVAPKSATALLERGAYRSRWKAFAAALADYVAATRLAPRLAAAHNRVCWLLAAEWRRDFDRARAACDTAISLDPRDAGVRDSAGLVALQQKRWPDAWREYDLSGRLDPTLTSALFGRGIAALRMGRVTEGRADIAAAVKDDPGVSATCAEYGQKP